MPARLLQVTALAAFFCASASHAAISLVNYDGFVVVQSGNTWNFHHESPENTALKGGTVYGRAGSAVDTVQPLTVKSRDVVPVGKGAVIDVAAKIPRANMARALIAAAKIGGRIGGGIVGGLAVDALIDYGLKNVNLGDDGGLKAESPDSNSILSDGYEYRYAELSGGFSTPQAACNAFSQYKGGTFFSIDAQFCVWKKSDGNLAATGLPTKQTSFTCPAGKYWISYTACSDKPEMRSMSEQEIYDKLASSSDWPSSSALALQGMLSYPDTRKILTPYPDNGVTLIGPPFVEGKTSTSTDTVQLVPGTNTPAAPGAAQTQTGTRTSTTTTTHPMTYSGNSVTHSTVNNTTTSITNNTTNVTTTENKTEETKDDEKPDECQKNPDRLGCQKIDFDTPEGEIPRKQIDVSWSPVDLGLGGGSCPAPVQIYENKQFSYQLACDNLYIIKPMVIAIALFVGGMIIFGGRAEQ